MVNTPRRHDGPFGGLGEQGLGSLTLAPVSGNAAAHRTVARIGPRRRERLAAAPAAPVLLDPGPRSPPPPPPPGSQAAARAVAGRPLGPECLPADVTPVRRRLPGDVQHAGDGRRGQPAAQKQKRLLLVLACNPLGHPSPQVEPPPECGLVRGLRHSPQFGHHLCPKLGDGLEEAPLVGGEGPGRGCRDTARTGVEADVVESQHSGHWIIHGEDCYCAPKPLLLYDGNGFGVQGLTRPRRWPRPRRSARHRGHARNIREHDSPAQFRRFPGGSG
jgi:hypothetical protein